MFVSITYKDVTQLRLTISPSKCELKIPSKDERIREFYNSELPRIRLFVEDIIKHVVPKIDRTYRGKPYVNNYRYKVCLQNGSGSKTLIVNEGEVENFVYKDKGDSDES